MHPYTAVASILALDSAVLVPIQVVRPSWVLPKVPSHGGIVLTL